MREAVEGLFFFNSRQRLLLRQIESSVEQTGVPLIVEREGRVSIGVPSDRMQCLFACDHANKPIGAALYCRPAPDRLWISHLAVDPEVSISAGSGSGLAGVIVNKIMQIARSIKGVTRVQLPYRPANFLRVRGPASRPLLPDY